MKKRILASILTGLLLVMTSGCASEKDMQTDTKQPETKAEDTQADAGTEEITGSTDQKTVVVYFSATGNTKTIAEEIADVTDGELFELQPKEPYTEDDLDYNDDNSRVCKEHADKNQRNVELVSTTVDNWQDVDVVYLGYPIWWGEASWVVDQFVENNDFTGKTVIPFCTSASSGIGSSGSDLAEMAGTGEWLNGERFSSDASKDDVKAWIESLGL